MELCRLLLVFVLTAYGRVLEYCAATFEQLGVIDLQAVLVRTACRRRIMS